MPTPLRFDTSPIFSIAPPRPSPIALAPPNIVFRIPSPRQSIR
jgi:hypothetical protein